jgi:DNA-binding LacI/PurR family transcriptional regulator
LKISAPIPSPPRKGAIAARQPQPSVKTASLKDVADSLRLSQTTVSRVLNQTTAASRIPQSTQKRVWEAAALLRYEANPLARALRSGRSLTIGVMVPEISEGYSTMVLGGIEDALLKEGYFYFVVSHRRRQDLLNAYPQLLLARAVEGIIAVDTIVPTNLGVPVTSVSGHHPQDHLINIQLDQTRGVRLALEHLHALGHRKIAVIKGQAFSSDTSPRWKAIKDVCGQLGLRLSAGLTVQLEGAEPGTGPGRAAAARLLAGAERFTALFAFNDLSAIGAIAALCEAGLRVPEDVSVIGFDDIDSASTNNPGLSTVRQPLREMGALAASELLRLIRGDHEHRSVVRVQPALIVRQSTARPPDRTAQA